MKKRLSIKGIKKILFDHKVAQMPHNVSTLKNKILFVQIATTAVMDAFSFAIKGAQAAIANEMNVLAFILIICYFLK